MSANWRLGLVLSVAVIAFLFLLPSFVDKPSDTIPGFLPQRPLNRGLDLQGGLHLELKVETEKAVENSLNRLSEQLDSRLREERVRIKGGSKVNRRNIISTVRGDEGAQRLTKLIEDEFGGLREVSRSGAGGDYITVTMTMTDDEVAAIEQYAIDQGIETIRNRIDQFGVAEPVIVPQGKGEILIQLPGLGSLSADKIARDVTVLLEEKGIADFTVEPMGSQVKVILPDMVLAEEIADSAVGLYVGLSRDKLEFNPDGKVELVLGLASSQRAKKLIGQTAQLEFHLLDESMTPQAALAGGVPPDSEILYGKPDVDLRTGKQKQGRPAYLVKKRVLLTGEVISEARLSVDQNRAQYYVMMEFNSQGKKLFGDITTQFTQKYLAIVLDGVVQSAPVIREPITGGRASISGTFTRNEARDLAIALRSGSLPAPVSVMHEIEVGASLGNDSIKAGILSLLIGFGLVVLFMAVYYKGAGFLAVLALVLNVLVVLGALAAFNATLTLPGIAGIVLTIGMAVDANVLIFERIREELRLGKSPLNAVDSGYAKAFTTILDANVTTLIAAIVLGWLGTGPIRGFAVTLGIGILASMFTAVVGTRAGFDKFLAKRGTKRLSI